VQVARVIGDVVATRKDPSLGGVTLLVLQPIDASSQPYGRTLVAADAAGAGVGEVVFFVRGKEAAFPFYPALPPVDASVVGIVDDWSVDPAPEPAR
jgi:microcompartment protein CcmK/EutM